MQEIPTFDRYMNPILSSLASLGGSASIQELNEHVVAGMGLTDQQLQVAHDDGKTGRTEVEYRMAWARTYLKKAGFIENNARGVWVLTIKGREQGSVDPTSVRRVVNQLSVNKKQVKHDSADKEDTSDGTPESTDGVTVIDWRERLLTVLQTMPPASFERLCQRLLRECGFVEVNVTGRSGDGGIDGTGILRMQGMLSFQVFFQCKRMKGSVGPALIREFRGAMVGRRDKGLFLTTGTFTRDAHKVATRDGAPPLDLVDGEQVMDLVKKFSLGVQTIMVESVSIDANWFVSL